MKTHRPPQILTEGETTYFITGRTYGGIPHLVGEERKNEFRDILLNKTEKYLAKLKNWVILNNHYHFLLEFENGLVLPKFMKELHGSSSFEIKKLPPIEIVNEEQILLRELTPMERRMEKQMGEFWRRLKSANTNMDSVIANFSSRSLKDIPFWYSYMSHVIRDELDYFRHFNYIVQNPIKHGLVENPWDYKFSGIFDYEKDYILDALRRYPIIDFGGNYD